MKNLSRYDNSTNNDMADLYESALMNKSMEQILLEESNEPKDETLEEGWWDRAKMRGQQAVGAVQGAGQQLKGKVQQTTGNVMNKAASTLGKVAGVDTSQGTLAQKGQQMQQQGQQNVDQGQQQSQQRLVQAAAQITKARITTFLNDLMRDLQKVGITEKSFPTSEWRRIQTTVFNIIQDALPDQSQRQKNNYDQ